MKKGLFLPARYRKYSEIIKIDNEKNALASIVALYREYENARTRTKKTRIKRVVQYTVNRLKAMLNRKKLSKKEYWQTYHVLLIYRVLDDFLDGRISDTDLEEFIRKTKKLL